VHLLPKGRCQSRSAQCPSRIDQTRGILAKTLYCWRCKADFPMLEEHERADIAPLLDEIIFNIQEYSRIHLAPLHEAIEKIFFQDALERYFEITGFRAIRRERHSPSQIDSDGPAVPFMR
jgi:hypothetical protein